MKKVVIISALMAVALIASGVYYYQKQYFLPGHAAVKASENVVPQITITEAAKNKEVLTQVLKAVGIKKAMQMLFDESGGGSKYDCHQPAHKIGRAAYKLFGDQTFGDCNNTCHGGCYHGAMESMLYERGTSNLAATLDSICSRFTSNFAHFNCLHGIGHGVMAYTDYNMPEALDLCKQLNNSFNQSACYGGVVMENIITGQGGGVADDGHKTSWVNNTDPLFPCDAIDQDYQIQYQCYQQQTGWMLRLFNGDFKKTAEACLTAPSNMIPVCFKSLGRDSDGHSLHNLQGIANSCSVVPQKYYDQCITGAMYSLVDFYNDLLQDQAINLCKLVPEYGKEACYAAGFREISIVLDTNPSAAKNFCSQIEQPYQQVCTNQFIDL